MAVDLNADVGEGFGRWSLGDDAGVLDAVSSANVACGFHAGDPLTMRATCAAARARGVAVGAHVGYRDLVGFGRRYVDAGEDELAADVLYQLGALAAVARAEGTAVRHVKPHGALYTEAARGGAHARAVVAAVTAFDASLPVVGLAGSPFLDLARGAGLVAVAEAFADRGYTADGALVDRRLPGALLHDPAAVAARVADLATTGTVVAVDGTRVRVEAGTVCVHGDTPGAVAVARAVRGALAAAGVEVRALGDAAGQAGQAGPAGAPGAP